MIEPPSSQRSATRAPIDRTIRLQFDDSLDVDEGHCINISIGGMFVHTDAPRPPGTLVRFELPLNDELSIRGLGEVVWQQRSSGQSKGVGIKFRFLEQRDRQQIFKLVSQHIKARLEREGEPRPRPDEGEPAAPESMAFSPSQRDDAGAETVALKAQVLTPPSAPASADDFSEEIRADETLRIDRALLESVTASEANSPPEPETLDPSVTSNASEPGLFDRWQAPEPALDETSEPADDSSVVAGFAPEGAMDTDLGSSGALSPLPDTRGRPRRKRDRSWLIAALLTAAVAAGGAYLLRDRFFTGLVGGNGSSAAQTGGATSGDSAVDTPTQDDDAPDAGPGSGMSGSEPRTLPPIAVADSSPQSPSPADRPTQTSSGASASQPTANRPRVTVPPTPAPQAPIPQTPVSSGLDVPAEPLPAEPLPAEPIRAEPQPAASQAVDQRPATRLENIRWQRRNGELVVILELDGSITDSRLRRFRLGGPTPREVVVLVGMDGPYRQSQIAVDEGRLSGVRTGFHRKTRGDEIHVVLDLAGPNDVIAEIRNLGDRIELIVGDS